ncbi:putative reverse transcriptase domain-containing protein [Tanacetum coccineum]
MDEPMENPRFDEEAELNEFMDNDQDVGDEEIEEWLMAPVTPPRDTVTVPSTYENQQLQTRLSDMEKREGTWITYMSWMEKHLAVLEKKLTGPPTGPQWLSSFPGNEQDEAFRILKEKLYNAPVLALLDGPDDFVIYCDASNYCLGALQMCRGKVIGICVKTVEEA